MARKTKILVVDDDHQCQQVVQFILEERGFDVSVCNDGIEAKAAVDHFEVDLIISDYMMP
ncbi:MAG: response regulator, partial [Deltaproteobacteria bacterium]|nr:response regulator [Deltaproteobacteria bacterium]